MRSGSQIIPVITPLILLFNAVAGNAAPPSDDVLTGGVNRDSELLMASVTADCLITRLHYVIDGDSLVVLSGDKPLELRLWGIDAPEYDQPGSADAEKELVSLAACPELTVCIKDRDRYGRSVSIVECRGININEEMVASGNAWVHPYYCREPVCRRWKKLESSARKNNLGLWKWADPIPPWKWKSMYR